MKRCVFDQTELLIGSALPEAAGADFYARFFDRAYLEAHAGACQAAGGRGQTLLYELDGLKLVLRHSRRGGLWGRIMGDRYVAALPGSRRVEAEWELLAAMRGADLPVPEPVLARISHDGIFLRQDLITAQIPDTENLAEYLAEQPLPQEEYRRLGEMLQRFFAWGLEHTDLNLRNILRRRGSGEFFLIDFDKCSRHPLTEDDKSHMLARLLRSLMKERTKNPGLHFAPAELTPLVAAARG